MKHRSFALLAPLLLWVAAFAQAPQTPPQPAPELKKLDYFAGTWKRDAGGKLTGTLKFEWMQGNFVMLLQGNESGVHKWLGFYGYDSTRKVYTYASFGSSGEYETWAGAVKGDTWTGTLKWVKCVTS